MTLRASIVGIGLWGPGLEGWDASRVILAGAPYEPRPSPAPPPSILAPTERRRAGPVVRLALAVAAEAAAASGLPPASLRGVFTSSNGDGVVVGSILDALSTAAAGERVVSPTQFHNSVHNAAAGYWSIAMGSQEPATCLGCHDDSWAAGLLTAMASVVSDRQPVLLCGYDHPLPAPLAALRPCTDPFGVGLVLAPSGSRDITVQFEPEPAPGSEPGDPALLALMRGNAIARALPLLIAIARGGPASVTLPYLDGRLTMRL